MMQPGQQPSDRLVGKLVELGVVIVDNVIYAVPALMIAATAFAVAWFNKRTNRLKKDVRDAAVDAERKFGAHTGAKKHAHVSSKLKETWSGIPREKLDKLIQTEGVEAAHEFRDSHVPPEPTN